MNELFIDRSDNGIDIALLCNKQLTELSHEHESSSFQIGDVYLGRIKKIMPSLNAAFVDVGHERDAFLHYTDLGPNLRSVLKLTRIVTQGGLKDGYLSDFSLEEEIIKTGKISDVLKKGQEILVQVFKEPISSKGPRITADFSFAGRFSVLVPFSNSVSISKKIGNPTHKKRLKQLVDKIRPENFGIIVRTVAEDATIEDIEADLLELKNKWIEMVASARNARPTIKVLGEISKTETILRDLLNDEFAGITINNPDYFKQIKEYVSRIAPGKQSIVKLYNGKNPMFQHYGIDKQIKASFGKNVAFSNGAYLIIEHTEAMHVIDVNSGRKSSDTGSQQEGALKINLEATREIARQLRLRDLGGIIVVDFIDLKNPVHKKELNDALIASMKSDRSRHNILPMSKFGLVQITRERVRPEMNIVTTELCPSCNGSGTIQSSMLLTDRIEEKLTYLWQNQNQKDIRLRVNPIYASYLTKGLYRSVRFKWFMQYKKWVKVVPDATIHLSNFVLENEFGEEVN